MSTPGRYDLTILQGATLARPFVWQDSAGAIINITGYTARMQVRSKQDGSLLLDCTSGNGKLVIDGPAGKITLTLSAAETAALSWVEGAYDLELVSGSGVVTRLLEGRATVSPEVTR